MTDADEVMKTQHFGSDPANIRIRIGFNPKIRTHILVYFWLRLGGLAEVWAVWAQSVIVIIIYVL